MTPLAARSVRQGVELLLGREVGGQALAAGAVGAGDQLGQAVIGLRPDHQVDRRLRGA